MGQARGDPWGWDEGTRGAGDRTLRGTGDRTPHRGAEAPSGLGTGPLVSKPHGGGGTPTAVPVLTSRGGNRGLGWCGGAALILPRCCCNFLPAAPRAGQRFPNAGARKGRDEATPGSWAKAPAVLPREL